MWFGVPGCSAWTPQWPEQCLGGGPENLHGWPPDGPCHGSRSDRDKTKQESVDHVQTTVVVLTVLLFHL